MDERQPIDDWQLEGDTYNGFDDVWNSDFDAAEFQSTMAADASYMTSGPIDDQNTLSSFDDFVMGSGLLDDTAGFLNSKDHFESFTLQQFMQQDRPSLQPSQHTLPRRRSKYVLRKSAGHTNPIAIPSGSNSYSPIHSLAIQRWQNSPPEDEAASLSAIYNAMEQRPQSGGSQGSQAPNLDAFRTYRGPSSTTSLDSGVSESSVQSVNSNKSVSSQPRRRRVSKTHTPTNSKGKKPKDSADRIFKCTFCCDTFKHKYDWSRHEKSLHLNMEEWVCAPHGASVVLPLTRRAHCAYCSALDPTQDHLESHNYSTCQGGQTTPRTFRRKDHLVQHLRLVHCLDTLPLIDDWKVASSPVVSRCGFCNATLRSWDERTDHLAAHFRSGKTMADWRGDHGFEDNVTVRVSDAFPPYLIAAQAKTLVPFSATNHDSIDHTKQVMSQMELEMLTSNSTLEPEATQTHNITSIQDQLSSIPVDETLLPRQGVETGLFADILTRHLARFARQQMFLGIVPTDEMFQRESRRLLYQDADDEWNQTVADSAEWIKEFRQRTGFNTNPGI